MQDYGFRTELILHDAFISLPGARACEVDGAADHSHHASILAFLPGRRTDGARWSISATASTADFAGTRLRGHIVLVEGIATPAVAQRAPRGGRRGTAAYQPARHICTRCASRRSGAVRPPTRSAGMPATVVCTVNNADGGGDPRRARTPAHCRR